MIGEDVRAKIRRLYFAEHWKIGTIAAELGVHRDTVACAVDTSRFSNCRFKGQALILDPYRDFIRATVEQYPRLRATRLLEMIRSRGYQGSVFPLRRYVRLIRPTPICEAFFRLSTLPGEEAQVDWGSFGKIRVDGALRPLSCFVMVLSWSRATFARFTLDQTLESFLRCHVQAFKAFGGVPRSALYDNLKSVVLEREGDLIRFHPRIQELAGHYHFAAKPIAVARGNQKGRVERRIRDLRESFFAARSFGSLEDRDLMFSACGQSLTAVRSADGREGADRKLRRGCRRAARRSRRRASLSQVRAAACFATHRRAGSFLAERDTRHPRSSSWPCAAAAR